MANLYILAEELPKSEILIQILEYYCAQFNKKIESINNPVILPVFTNKKFNYRYKFLDFNIEDINQINIEIVSGKSSFVDYLIFEQDSRPEEHDLNNDNDGNQLKLIIEETKTNDIESRNQVFQRISKFIYAEHFYKNVKKLMFYNIQINNENKIPTDSNKLGINILLTLDVDIIGINKEYFKPFEDEKELIKFKDDMNLPNHTNIPVKITPCENQIFISGSLENPRGSGNLNHDPNKGQLPALVKVLRKFDCNEEIIIINHGVSQQTIDRSRGNKFLFLAKILDFKLENIELPEITLPTQYWRYNIKLEKNGTMLLHLTSIFNNSHTTAIFYNHGGGELSYFHNSNGEPTQLSQKNLPDLILKNELSKEILIIEGKTIDKLQEGLDKLNDFDSIEEDILNQYYDYKINRWVVTCNGIISKQDLHQKQLFHLNEDGTYLLNEKAPQWLNESFERVINY